MKVLHLHKPKDTPNPRDSAHPYGRPTPSARWPSQLSAPVDPQETLDRMRAQSILTPTPKGGACPPLTITQARDVLAWYDPEDTL